MQRPPAPIRIAMLLTVFVPLVAAAAVVTGLVIGGEFTVQTIGITAFFVILAAILIPVAVSLGKGSPSARSVVLTWSILLTLSLATIVPTLGWWAVFGILAAVTTLVCLALPSSRAFIRPRTIFSEDA